MKNVLQVMDYAAPYRGSFMESLDFLDKELNKDGAEIIYVFPPRATSNAAAKWIKEMADSGRKIYFLSGHLLKDIALLQRVIKDHDVGISHTHFENFRTDLAVYAASLLTGIKKVRHFRNHLHHASPLKKAIKKIIFSKCDFVCVSASVSAGIKQEFPRNRCYSIENAIQYKRLDSHTELRRADFGIADDSVLCLMMGFDFKRKGVDLAIDAITALRAEKDVRLMISVSSNLENVKANIRNQLGTIPDWISLVPPRNDVASYFRMADIFISASREEGFCNALVEAAYCERMVIASKIPAQGDLKIPYAFWFESENAQDLKHKIAQAMAKMGHYDQELRQAKAAVEQTYDLDLWAQKIVSIYETAYSDDVPRHGRRAQPI